METGHEFYASYNGSPIFDADGNLALAFITIRDITEQVRVEAERERVIAELESANREMEAFIYSVAHDLRAPLRSITGFSDLAANATRQRR